MAAMLKSFLTLTLFLSLATSAVAIDLLWTDSTTGQILRGPAGGGAAQVLFDASDYPLSPIAIAPFGIAADESFVYWSDSITGQILRGSLDGQGAATLIFDRDDYPGSLPSARPAGLSVDSAFVYWADSVTGAVLRGPKNGAGAVTSLYTAANYPGSPSDSFPWDVKVSGNQLYWSDAGTSQILKGAADGSSAVQALFTSATERVNLGLAIDGSQVYWGDTDTAGQAGSVLSGSISGSGSPATLYELADYPTSETSAAPTGIAAQNGQLYWVDSLTKQVLTASASGSGEVSVLFDISDYPGSPSYISPTFLTVISTGYDADFDGNGVVNGSDFLKWQRGQSPAPLSAEDLALWKEQFGSPPPPGSVLVVPEPLAIASAFNAVLVAFLFSRRRQRFARQATS